MHISSSFIPEIINSQTNRKTTYIPLRIIRQNHSLLQKAFNKKVEDKNEVIIFDAETEKDLLSIAKLCRKVRVISGSAGLASELPEGIGLRTPKPTLTVCGSARSSTRRQALNLEKRLGAVKLSLNTIKVLQRIDTLQSLIIKGNNALSAGNHVILMSAPEEESVNETLKFSKKMNLNPSETGKRIIKALSEVSAKLIENNPVSGIILTGGDTALQVCQNMLVKSIEIIGEVQPCIPLLELSNGIKAVTKAGGFGNDDSMVEIVKYLKRMRR
jgi:uncharacterized protein YgbK (DUF1537 family)